MGDDWDLHAVVRGCAATNTTASNGQLFLSTSPQQDISFSTAYSFQDLLEPRRDSSFFVEELHDFYKPKSPQSLPISPLPVFGNLQDNTSLEQQKQKSFSFVTNGSKACASHNPISKSKRRKNNLKKVCHVPAESLSSDMWSWRKYGQKPIKGSPYPRGYYRCSTLKGCMARKQVERNRSDPGMFIVTYTGEHNHPVPTHRNSLAGSTRRKLPETPNYGDSSNKPSCSSEMSQVPEKSESDEEDDFFSGLEDFVGPGAGDCVSGHFPASFSFPWLLNSAGGATTTTAGGG